MSVVMQKLDRKHLPYEVLRHAPTYTGLQEAARIGIDAALVVKSVLLDTAGGHVLAVLPANRKLAMSMVRKGIGDPGATLATEREIEHDFPAYELGALPPLQSALRLPVYVDPEVMTHETVVLADSHTESIRARTEDVFSGEWVTVTRLVRHKPEVSQ